MTISSAVNLLIVGVLLVFFVILAPNGLVGCVQDRLRRGEVNERALLEIDQTSASASAASWRSTA